MDNIQINASSVQIMLNPEIYNSLIIKQAIKDFSGVADIKQNGKIIIVPKEKKDIENIGYEFCNYLIGLVQSGQT